MAALTLGLFALYLALSFGLRTLMQRRRTGSTGFQGISGRTGSAEWIGGILFVAAIVLYLAAPTLTLAGIMKPFAALDNAAAKTLGVTVFTLGAVGTLVAQGAMGTSWRIGVDESERTQLVTAGPFAVVRNPIFTAMISASLGMTFMVPNAVSLAAFALLVAAVELQVRFVEEPYLIRTHGDRYLNYASRTGRLLPKIGRLGRRAPQ